MRGEGPASGQWPAKRLLGSWKCPPRRAAKRRAQSRAGDRSHRNVSVEISSKGPSKPLPIYDEGVIEDGLVTLNPPVTGFQDHSNEDTALFVAGRFRGDCRRVRRGL